MQITVNKSPGGLQWEVRFQMEHHDTLSQEMPLYDDATDLAEPLLRQVGAPVDRDPEDIDYWLERGDPEMGWGCLVFQFTF